MTEQFLHSISVEQMAAYLQRSGWLLSGKGDLASVWRRDDLEDAEIVLPLRKDLKDYEDRVSDALRRMAAHEGRDVGALVRELSDAANNLMAVRVIGSDTAEGRIPLRDGVLLIEKAKALFSAAAMAVTSPRLHFHGAPAREVQDYTNSLLLDQTEVGSYIVKVVAPTDSFPLPDAPALDVGTFGNAVVHRLVDGLQHLTAATRHFRESGGTGLFDVAAMRGASANMCDALLGFSGVDRTRSFEVRVVGAAAGWLAEETHTFNFTGEDVAALEFASNYYKNDYVLHNREIIGSITYLQRQLTDDIGTITVRAVVEDTERSVRIELGSEEYHKGVIAHDRKLLVRCRGDLHVKNRTTRLLNPRDFEILEMPSLF